FDFSLGNPNVAPPEKIKQAILQITNTADPVFLHGYMVNAGYPDVRKKISGFLNARYDLNLSENNIVMTVGAAGAINVVLKTILNPGDEVIVFTPFFGEYRWYVKNFGGEIVIVPNNPSGDFQPDLDGLERALSPRTKAVIINTPNNPSGAIYHEQTLKSIAEILNAFQKKSGNKIFLLSDEPYREIIFDGVSVPYPAKFYKNTFTAYSYSKALSLPGERIGYLTVPSEIDGFEEISQGLPVANRILGFVNSPSMFQRVAAECVDITVDTKIYGENRNILYENLTAMGYECQKPSGAFYLFPKAPGGDDAAFCAAAKEHRLLLVPGRAFGAPGYFRIAFCTKKETVQNSLDSFKKAIALI
ncbi:MAG: pyridoxal phosphate-dependent aminotransferase, partial [Defluviitaleaceae bacterium]|nr:pyridoxal phosphate-dependent aminotransferase [Defluviitaleaceae bacterium]